MDGQENRRPCHDLGQTGRTAPSAEANTHGALGQTGWKAAQPCMVVGWRRAGSRSLTGERTLLLVLLRGRLHSPGCCRCSLPKWTEILTPLDQTRLNWSEHRISTLLRGDGADRNTATSQDLWAAIFTVMGCNRRRIRSLFCILNVHYSLMWREGSLCGKMKWALISDWTATWRTPQIHTRPERLWLWVAAFTQIHYHTSSSRETDLNATHCHEQPFSKREGYVMYGATLIKYAERLLTLPWRPLWSTVRAAVSHTYLAAVRTLSKNNAEALPAGGERSQPLEEERKKTTSSNHYLGSDVSVSSDNKCVCVFQCTLNTAHFKDIFKINQR